jgi:hypothetical protein
LPIGVTAQPLALPAGATTGTLSFNAAADAALGPAQILISIEGGGATAVTLLVQDPSGSVDSTFGSGGIARVKFSYMVSTISDILVTADGHVMIAGNVHCLGGCHRLPRPRLGRRTGYRPR